MAPPTLLVTAERERDSITITIQWLRNKVNSHATTPLTEAQVNNYLKATEEARVKTTDTFVRITVVATPADMAPHNLQYITMMDQLIDLQFELQLMKDRFGPLTSGSSKFSTDIRLPRLKLPTFDGSLHDWMSFKDMFKSAVHNNPSISKAQKLTYLKTTLVGEAARSIKSLSTCDANYDIAWSQLEDRYQNDRELLFAILQRFTTQPVVQANSSSSIRSLIDVSKECIRSLEGLQRPVADWDDMLLFHMFQKLDSTSKEIWKQTLHDSSIPPLKDFMEFMESRSRALAAAGSTGFKPQTTQHHSGGGGQPRKVNQVHHAQAASSSSSCVVCSLNHPLFRCSDFIAMGVPERQELAGKHGLCFNCLRGGHSRPKCTSTGSCRICKYKHHSLLHKENNKNSANFTKDKALVLNHHSADDTHIQQTLLSTAMVKVKDCHGQHQLVRALLDGGSTSSFITESCLQRLGLRRSRVNAEVVGLSSTSVGDSRGAACLVISPHFNTGELYNVNALVLSKVTGQLPVYPCDPTVWPHLQGLQLADPSYHQPANIDLLLGADIFWYLIAEGRKSGQADSPVAIRSTLGWLIAGNLNSSSSRVFVHYADTDLDEKLQQFFQVESVPETRSMTKEEKLCEAHFNSTHKTDADGRFVVKLPFKEPKSALGSSRDIAVRRLKQLERRFTQCPDRKKEYIKFMEDYEDLGHMELISPAEVQKPVNPTCYIPHHFVLKESSTTTKFRVVFDASAKTSSGVSLNDTLMVGPTLQQNVIDILIRFRKHPVAFTADLAKFYCQIRLDPADTDMQRIVWRKSADEPIQDYRLLTATYGTASAPYLATKALHQLASNEVETLPLASRVALNDFYVDDCLSGAKTAKEAIELQSQLLKLTSRGGLDLRKWSSNCLAVMEAVPPDKRETKPILNLDHDQTIKALGIYWNTTLDLFQFKINLDNCSSDDTMTKRKLLSDIAKIFDPLGWLAPVIIRAKILMQDLWKLQTGWDAALPDSNLQQWYQFKNNLHTIEQITIARCVMPCIDYSHVDLIGFCDASEKAFAAVVYLSVYQPLGHSPD